MQNTQLHTKSCQKKCISILKGFKCLVKYPMKYKINNQSYDVIMPENPQMIESCLLWQFQLKKSNKIIYFANFYGGKEPIFNLKLDEESEPLLMKHKKGVLHLNSQIASLIPVKKFNERKIKEQANNIEDVLNKMLEDLPLNYTLNQNKGDASAKQDKRILLQADAS